MNKVFKVIWNEARSAYVVVSEIAKNHGSKSCSTKKLLAMLIATGVMTCASFDVLAAEPNVAPKTQDYQYVAFKDKSVIPPSDGAKQNITIDKKNKIKCTYVYDAKTGYWVRKGYVLTVDENGGKYTPLSQEVIRADVAYTGSGNTDYILQSVTSTVEANGTVTNMGDSLNKITAGSFAGVSHSGGTEVAGSWDYIIKDASWEGHVVSGNYKDGYVNLNAGATATAPNGFVNTESKDLKWDDSRQAYFYKNQRVDYSNMYVINGKLGVFTDFGGNKVYTGTVYGINNEILMTVKDKDNNFYSYWASEVTDPSATMATYRVEEYNKNLAKLVENDDALNRNDIKEVTLDTSKANSATIGLLRNGDKAVDGAITVTSDGGTEGNDTFVKISNTADPVGKTFATGSKVEAIGTKDATTGIKINGEDYTIKSGSKVSVAQNEADKTTTITVDGTPTIITDTDTHNKLDSAELNGKTLTITGKDGDTAIVDLSSIDTDTTYTAGKGIAIDNTNKNAISVKLKEGDANLVFDDQKALSLNKDLTVDSVNAGKFFMNKTTGIGYNGKAYITSTGLNANSQKITGVAAGTEDTDAVNVAQLKTAKTEVQAGANITSVDKTTGANGQDVYTINAKDTTYAAGNGITISGDNNAISVKLKEGENNLDVTADGLALKKDLTVNSVNTDKFFMDKTTGIGYDGKAYITSNGLNANSQKITNVAEGTADTDAVNYGQLKNISASATAAKTEIKGGTNIAKVDQTTAADGHMVYTVNANGTTVSGDSNVAVTAETKDNNVTNYGVKLKKDLAGIESISNGNAKLALNGEAGYAGIVNGKGASVFMQDSTTVINGVVDIDQKGKISGVAAGVADNDVVNVSQLNKVSVEAGKHTTLVAGDNVTLDTNKTDKGLEYTVNAVDTTYTAGNGITIDKDADNAISVKLNKDEANLAVDKEGLSLNKDLKGIESISNNTSKLVLREGWAGMQNGVGASVFMVGGLTTINDKVTVDEQGKISGVAAGVNNDDAVNVSQLKKVSDIANAGWNLSTNGVATAATNVKPGEYVDFSGDKNISVSHDGTKVQVKLNENIDVNSVQTNALNSKYNLSVGTMAENGIMPFFVNSTGDFYAAHNKFHVDKDGKVTATAGEIGNVVLQNGVYYGHSTLQDGSLLLTDDNGNHSYIDAKGAKLGKVTVAEDGKISGVAAGAVTADSTDAVNGSQLHAVATEAGKHSKVVNGNNTNVEETTVDGQKVYKVNLNNNIMVGDVTGKYVSISGTNGTIEATGAIATKDRVYADKGAKLADIDVTGNTISNGDAKLALDGAAGTAGMINGKGASLYMQDGTTVINNKVGIDQEGKITGVAAGKISADSTDAVNGSQLHAVQQEAGKHTKVVNGSNITVEETDQDGQKTYKVGLNKDILLGDITGKNVSISGTNGTIETTGYIATKDRVYADKGAKLADVDITGDTISNDKSSVKLDKEGTVTINNKVTIDGNGKVSGVADGEISDTSTDAVNGSQLKKTNDRVTNVENDVKNIQGDITNIKGDITNIKGDITTIKGDVTNLDNRVTKVEQTAGKHSSVSTTDSNLSIDSTGTNNAGGIDYKVSLNKDLKLDSVTTGDTKVTNAGLSIGDKTYVSKDGLNANNQTITNVADGKVEKGSTDAVNGGQLYETNQAIANNATNISSLSHSISNLDNRVNKVGAGAAALAALHPLDFDPDAKWDFAAGYGNYRGTNAAAVGAYYRPNEDTMFSVGGTFGNGENMVNAGVSFKLGAGSSHVSTSRVAMAKEIKELRGELEAMKSAMLDANAGKKIDTSKLQLFPDVPQNHWAYEYVAQLAGNGMIEGYPDGNFAGDRPMTRYEFAAILYRAMTKGAVLSDKILSEFSHELEYFTVDTVAKDKAGNPTIQRVRTVKANTNK